MLAMEPAAYDAVRGLDPMEAMTRLAVGIAKGLWDENSVRAYAKAHTEKREPTVAKTRSVSSAMLEAIERQPNREPGSVVCQGMVDGLWSEEDVDAWFENKQVRSAITRSGRKPRRGRYLTRSRRSASNTSPSGRFVPRKSLDVSLDRTISDGAKACLDLILSLCGRSTALRTFTKSIATQLGRTSRTVQNYLRALSEAGYLTRSHDQRTGVVTIVPAASSRPEPYKPSEAQLATDRAQRSSDPAVRTALTDLVRVVAATRLEEGTKGIAPLNPQDSRVPPGTLTSWDRGFVPKPLRLPRIGPGHRADPETRRLHPIGLRNRIPVTTKSVEGPSWHDGRWPGENGPRFGEPDDFGSCAPDQRPNDGAVC